MYQKITIIGRLGSDPKMKYMPDGTPVTSFSVAANEKWNDDAGNKHEKTVWFRVSVWGAQAEPCHQYLSRGRQVYVEGKLAADDNGGPRLWQSNTGETRASFEVRASQVKFLSSGQGNAAGAPADADDDDDDADDVPF